MHSYRLVESYEDDEAEVALVLCRQCRCMFDNAFHRPVTITGAPMVLFTVLADWQPWRSDLEFSSLYHALLTLQPHNLSLKTLQI